MAVIDTNFLALPGFVVKNDGGGQTITLQLASRYETPADPSVSPVVGVGWGDIDFSMVERYGFLMGQNGEEALPAPYAVTPAVLEGSRSNDIGIDTGFERTWGVYNFMKFVSQNPIHVTKMNIRASEVNQIPQQIIILTPDIFTGQMSRQIIDVASKKNAYQYQNEIVTIDGLDIYLCRNSIIRFNVDFRHNFPIGATVTDTPCYIDLTFDHYVSLEKGLMENVKLLNTASGELIQAAQQVQQAQAINNPNTVTLAADKAVSEVGVKNAVLGSSLAFPMRTGGVQTKLRR